MNKKVGGLGSLKHLCCVWIDACATCFDVSESQASSAYPGSDVQSFPCNNSPAPKMVAISSFFCVSGICDFVVSTFFVMKSKWYPMCLEENVQTTAKLYVVKKKICSLFAVNTALNDRVQCSQYKCTWCSPHVCSEMCRIGIYTYI